MCNRYRLSRPKQYIADHFEAPVDELQDGSRYNIAPTQPVVTVRKVHGEKTRHFTTMRWGLIPSWAKDISIGLQILNARSETVRTKPAFKDSILRKRCLIPTDGFYEWKKIGSVKQPYCFEVGEGDVFALAGLWDEWSGSNGGVIESCTILTTTPNSIVAAVHDRMPVIVPAEKYDLWLDPDVTNFEAIRDILQPYDASLMRRYPVSTKLNDSKNDDAESARPIVLEGPAQGPLS